MIDSGFETAFLSLQAFVAAFLLFHDWIPLGSLNNLKAVRREDSLSGRVFVTLLPGLPSAIGFYCSAKHFAGPYPMWLEILLWVTYGALLWGLLRAWWIPYLFRPDPQRAARYHIIFAGTHAFLPRRNGIVPNTLHVLFHFATVAVLIALFVRDRVVL